MSTAPFFLADLAAIIALETGVTVAELRGPGRGRRVSMPRQRLMAEGRALAKSSTKIGRYLNRDHSTVLYGARKHAERIAAEASESAVHGLKRAMG